MYCNVTFGDNCIDFKKKIHPSVNSNIGDTRWYAQVFFIFTYSPYFKLNDVAVVTIQYLIKLLSEEIKHYNWHEIQITYILQTQLRQ